MVKKKTITKDKKAETTPKEPVKKKQYHPSITDAKIKKLLDIDHIEELFFLVNMLNDDQLNSFIEHYKAKEITSTKDPRIDTIVKQSERSHELRNGVRDELASKLRDEYQEIITLMSSQRKKGLDVHMEDLKSMSIPLKIRMFSATTTKEDYYKVKKMLVDIKAKLDENEAKIKAEEAEKKAAENKKNKKAAKPETADKEAKIEEEPDKNKMIKKPETREASDKSEETKKKPKKISKVKKKPSKKS